MSVHAKRRIQGVGRIEYAVSASDIRGENHPLNKAFVAWLNGKPATTRQARKFLQTYPHYREIQSA